MSEWVTVCVSQGALRGRRATSRTGTPYYSFQGIPYAKPPVGQLRFKVAEPCELWSGVRDAVTEGSACSQYSPELKRVVGDEDCLHLSVFTTQLSAARPVMVWIHGGGFVRDSGSVDLHGPDYLLDEGVVLVTFNYRLGVLGFLCVDGPAAPGNVGLKDQVAALRWVQQNIASFGGDPNNVTIFGVSAGAASVQFHMLSPMSRGLFHRAIAQSGAAFNPWAWERHPREMAFRLGAALGCAAEDPQLLVDFLRTVDHERLVGAATQHSLSERDKHRLVFFPFVPCEERSVEGIERFLPAPPLQLLLEGRWHGVPYLTGATSCEGMLVLKFADLKDPETVDGINRDWERVLMPELRLPENYRRAGEVCAELRDFYLQGQPLGPATLPGFIDLFSDLLFSEGVDTTVRAMAAKAARVYYYRFSHEGRLSSFKISRGLDYPGACHGDDVGHLFRVRLVDPDLDPDGEDARTRARLVNMWTNFAKTGNPTPEVDSLLPIVWLPYTADSPCCLEISADLTVRQGMFEERSRFWEDLYRAPGIVGSCLCDS